MNHPDGSYSGFTDPLVGTHQDCFGTLLRLAGVQDVVDIAVGDLVEFCLKFQATFLI